MGEKGVECVTIVTIITDGTYAERRVQVLCNNWWVSKSPHTMIRIMVLCLYRQSETNPQITFIEHGVSIHAASASISLSLAGSWPTVYWQHGEWRRGHQMAFWSLCTTSKRDYIPEWRGDHHCHTITTVTLSPYRSWLKRVCHSWSYSIIPMIRPANRCSVLK